MTVLVVPFKVYSTVVFTFPVFGDNIFLGKMVAQVQCVLLVNVLDSKVVDCETEID